MTKTASPQPQKPARPQPAKKPAKSTAARDLLVRLTIPLVAAATTLALRLQLGMELGVAVVIALLVGTTLALLHVNYQRGAVIQDLRRDLMRMSAQSAPRPGRPMGAADMARHPAQQPRPNDNPMPPALQAPAAVPTPTATVLPSTAVDLDELAARAMDAAAVAKGSVQLDVATIAVMPPPAAVNDAVAVQPPPLPPVSIGVRPAPRHRAPEQDAVTEPYFVDAAMPPQRSSSSGTTNGRDGEVPPVPARLPSLEGATADLAQRQDRVADVLSDARRMADYWSVRPGHVAPLPASAPSPAATAPDRGDGLGLSALQPMPEPAKPVDAAEPLLQRNGQGGGDAAVDGLELEAMQKLIQQLAIQLNGPRPVEPLSQAEAEAEAPAVVAKVAEQSSSGSPPAVSDQVAQSVATSVAALRATADTMRHAADAAPSRPPMEVTVVTGGARAESRSAPQTSRANAGWMAANSPVPQRPGRHTRIAEASEAIASERIDVLLEPIMGLGDRKARHFEVSVRLRNEDGGEIDQDDLAVIAAGSGLLPKIDAAKMARTARVASRLQSRSTGASLFSSLAGESLSDRDFLEAFDEVFAHEPALLRRLVLSFSQNEVRRFSDGHWQAVEAMADRGLRLALQDVTDLDMDFENLREHGFDFVKLDASVFLDGLPAPEGVLPAPEICRHFANMGLALIVGEIGDETSLAQIFGFGVIFGQGTLFGGARPVTVDTGTPPKTAAA